MIMHEVNTFHVSFGCEADKDKKKTKIKDYKKDTVQFILTFNSLLTLVAYLHRASFHRR